MNILPHRPSGAMSIPKTQNIMLKKNLFLLAGLLFATTSLVQAQYAETGLASYYADKLHGRTTSSGERYDKEALTGAHGSLPVGSIVRVTRLDNDESVTVRINDCCVACAKGKGHVIDLSRAAAERIDMIRDGHVKVMVELLTLGDGKPCCGKSVQPKSTTTPKELDKQLTAKGGTVTKTTALPVTDGTYRAEVLKPISKGYGVQIGAYADLVNAERRIDELKKKGFNNLLINVNKANTKTPYRVVLGPFDTQTSADGYNKSLIKKYKIKGFVMEL